jgi:hypothetical protein
MNSFDLLHAFLAQCEKENWALNRDPHHDEMEWNHTLPQNIFGDQSPGQWLTKEQHAIVSCLQTIAFKKMCWCPWHKKLVPDLLWKIALQSCEEEFLSLCVSAGRKGGLKGGKTMGDRCVREQLGIHDPANGEKCRENSRKNGKISGPKATAQRWQSLIDGFVSHAPGVAKHNRHNGWDPDARVRIL